MKGADVYKDGASYRHFMKRMEILLDSSSVRDKIYLGFIRIHMHMNVDALFL